MHGIPHEAFRTCLSAHASYSGRCLQRHASRIRLQKLGNGSLSVDVSAVRSAAAPLALSAPRAALPRLALAALVRDELPAAPCDSLAAPGLALALLCCSHRLSDVP